MRLKIIDVLIKAMSDGKNMITYSNELLLMLCQILLGSDGDNEDLIKGLCIDDFMRKSGDGSYSYSELLLIT